MNVKGDSNMKIWSVFSLVIVFHAVILGLLLVQPGCQSQQQPKPTPAATATGAASGYTEPAQPEQLDSAFNAGMGGSTTSSSRAMSAPTRPTGVTRAAPKTGGLEPVLKPVRDDLSLPSETVEYTVQKGDSLSRIASKYKVTLNDLRKANGLKKDTIFVGQTLLIPTKKVSDGVQAAEAEHSIKQVVVQAGDSLNRIATRVGTTVNVLKKLNGLTSDRIYVGQKLAVPESANVAAATSTLQPVRSRSVPVVASAGQKTYKVQPGDTPGAIARKFGISAAELMAANGITDARKLYAGKEIMVPVSGSVTSQPTSQPAAQPVSTQPSTLAARSAPSTTSSQVGTSAPGTATTASDISMLEALEDEDLPFVEVEAIGTEPGN